MISAGYFRQYTSLVLVFFIMFMSGSARAAMITYHTENIDTAAQTARQTVNTFMAREDVKNALIGMGVNPEEASGRIKALSDSEAIAAAQNIDNAPAGAGGFITVIAGLLVLIIAAILDLTKVILS
ncbi:PA2779 family protein [Seleniivibrio woodruffii]|uniref:PA2779 family protein n=1 Tax=Seleniivibrio woodruffii TaxID=1078050 RepID=UPI0026F3771F|nr:PA2779 family protein [Seleniivibrio woodruffii]